MLTLNDGRIELYQWDTGRKLSVAVECTQVHYSNKVFGRSIDVDVVDGVAIIPDILLQTDKELTAWAFVGTPENGYTKISKTFKVNRRNKPADYVFTPPEQTTLGELVERLQKIEETQDPDVIENAVKNYLDANPVRPGATTEQAAQIEQNKTDIADLQAEIEDKQPKGDYVKTVNGNKPDATGNVVVATGGNGSGQNPNQSGLSDAAKTLLITILRSGIYSTNQSANITALEAELASSGGNEGGEDTPDVPDVPDTGVVITQSGSVLTLSGVPAITSITQSGNVLTLA